MKDSKIDKPVYIKPPGVKSPTTKSHIVVPMQLHRNRLTSSDNISSSNKSVKKSTDEILIDELKSEIASLKISLNQLKSVLEDQNNGQGVESQDGGKSLDKNGVVGVVGVTHCDCGNSSSNTRDKVRFTNSASQTDMVLPGPEKKEQKSQKIVDPMSFRVRTTGPTKRSLMKPTGLEKSAKAIESNVQIFIGKNFIISQTVQPSQSLGSSRLSLLSSSRLSLCSSRLSLFSPSNNNSMEPKPSKIFKGD